MRKGNTEVSPALSNDVRILFPEAGLKVIFDECDRFDRDETGGRVVGTFTEHGGKLTMRVTGIIEPGPQAKRSPVSLFQDGEYQESIFRRIESQHPEIDHLGNWHTHHVNGLPTLSSGDIDTYHRIVNHHKHNTLFFYALLVTTKHRTSDPHRRYSIKHFLFRRGAQDFYEVQSRHVKIVDTALVWPVTTHHGAHYGQQNSAERAELAKLAERVYDRDIIQEFYKEVLPFASQKLGVYWRGLLDLLDGSKVQVVVLEDSGARGPKFSVAFREIPAALQSVATELAQETFPSARAALIVAERSCNRALYRRAHNQGT